MGVSREDSKWFGRAGAQALLIAALLHLPLWLLRPWASMPQPVFELDLLLAIALFAAHRGWGVVAIVVAWSLSLLRAVAVNYHFHNVAEFVDTLRFADLVSYTGFVSGENLLVAGAAILIVVVVLGFAGRCRPGWRSVLGLTLALAVLDALNGSATALGLGRDRPFSSVNVLGTAGYNLLRAERDFLRSGAQPLAPWEPPPPSYRFLRDAAGSGDGSVMVILVESLGLPRDAALRAWLSERLRGGALTEAWSVEDDVEDFVGGTVAGEMRVLCGLRGHYSRLTPETAESCLPLRFARGGREAVALHGFSPRMFDRAAWWPVAGFGALRFADDLSARGGRRCAGAFNGICDHDLMAAAVASAGEAPRFVYALTINTHLPLPKQEVSQALRTLCRTHGVQDAGCQLLEAQGRSLADIRTQLAGAPTRLSRVVVVGDHSPPFSGAEDRAVFSPTQVPVWLLRRPGP